MEESFELRSICNAFPLYHPNHPKAIYTENFHNWEDDDDDGYYIGYQDLDTDEFVVRFEGTKMECAKRLEAYLLNSK